VRILVTGSHGFVGRHLVHMLEERGHDVVQADRSPDPGGVALDVTDRAAVAAAIETAAPEAIAHLAAQAFVPDSQQNPTATFDVNVGGTLNVLEAVRRRRDSHPGTRVLVVSSAEVYGVQPAESYPLRESAPPLPRNPYAASKAATESLALAYAHSYGVDAVVTRAFNHIGPGQDVRFAVADFAAQLARIASGGERLLLVGNLDASRDFLDVRDVCAAYAVLLEGNGAAGEIYNICSGVATSMKEVLRRLIMIARVPVEVRDNPERMRAADIPVSVGTAAKLRDATGWSPAIPLGATLRAVYDDARSRFVVAS
jgi:GDP-4-dehydro-6-deoxy-D-mannose reductase